MERLAHRRRRWREAAALSVVAALAGGLAFLVSTRLGIALEVAAAVQATVALAALLGRRALIGDLALAPEAYVIPEVAAFGHRVAGAKERRRLARWIQSIVRDTDARGAYYVRRRVRRFARELESLARDLSSPALRLSPPAAVACRRLLTYAVESPLYNPNLTDEDLAAALLRIRAGFRSPDRP